MATIKRTLDSSRENTSGEVSSTDCLTSSTVISTVPWKMQPRVKKQIRRLIAEAMVDGPSFSETAGENWLSEYCTPLLFVRAGRKRAGVSQSVGGCVGSGGGG